MAPLRVVLGVGLAAGGALVALFSLFLVLYEGGDGTYVKIGGRDVDAQLVGVSGLALTVGMLLAAWVAIRGRSTY